MQMVRQDNHRVDRKESLAPCTKKDLAQQIDVANEQIALVVSQRYREKIRSSRNKISAIQNHAGDVYDEKRGLVQQEVPGFRFTASGLQETGNLRPIVRSIRIMRSPDGAQRNPGLRNHSPVVPSDKFGSSAQSALSQPIRTNRWNEVYGQSLTRVTRPCLTGL
jgi:hypothetical protein